MKRRALIAVVASLLVGCVATAPTATQPAPTSSPVSTATRSPAAVIAPPTTPATSAPEGTASATPEAPVHGVVALGHSALTGEGSDPARRGQEARENSWATGTNPEVNSIYQRLVALRPETEGQVANAAEAGASASRLAGQARTALASVPAPQLVIIQTIDGDIRCDGSDDRHVPEFGAALMTALEVITEASPQSRVLILSQAGRPASEAEALADEPELRRLFGGTGMCDFFDPNGDLVQERLATLTGIIEQYEAEQLRVCSMFPQCSTDNGVMTTYVREPDHVAEGDWNHLGVRGQAAIAELIWPTVAELLELDGSGSGPWILYQFYDAAQAAPDLGLTRPDGTDNHRLPGGPGNRWHPDWSPDGMQIAYDWETPADVAEIAVVGLNGSDERSLLECVDPCYGNGGPAWSPDGRAIGFDGAEGPTAEHAGDLCYLAILDLDSGEVTRFLEHEDCSYADSYLRFSPDGERVVFQRQGPAGLAIFTASIDGQEEFQLTEWGLGVRPDWSPDGEWIVFMSVEPESNPGQAISLHRVRPDGTDLEQLTDPSGTTIELYPRYLPDGSGIIFSRCPAVDAPNCETRMMGPDGSEDRLLLPPFAQHAVHVMWQPSTDR